LNPKVTYVRVCVDKVSVAHDPTPLLQKSRFWGPYSRHRGFLSAFPEARPQNLKPHLYTNFEFCFTNVVSDFPHARRNFTLKSPLLHPRLSATLGFIGCFGVILNFERLSLFRVDVDGFTPHTPTNPHDKTNSMDLDPRRTLAASRFRRCQLSEGGIDIPRAAAIHPQPETLNPKPSKPRYRNVQWFRGGLVFKAHRLLYH